MLEIKEDWSWQNLKLNKFEIKEVNEKERYLYIDIQMLLYISNFNFMYKQTNHWIIELFYYWSIALLNY